jgi:hypothetical protein
MPAANNLSTNWQNAGLAVVGGIPARNTQCGSTVNPTGVTPPAANDDANTINTAISNCTSGDFVQLGAGTFQIDTNVSGEQIKISQSVTLRGTGSCNNASYPYCQTVINNYTGAWPTYNNPGTYGAVPQCGSSIHVPPIVPTQTSPPAPATLAACNNTVPMISIGAASTDGYGWGVPSFGTTCNWPATAVNPTTTGCGTTLAADAAQGATTVQVASTSNFSVGMWVLIDESPQLVTTTNPITGQASIQASSEFLNSSPAPVVMRLANPDANNCTYSFCTNRVNEELHLISAIGAGPCPGVNCTLTFDDPLTMAYRQSGSHDARVYWPTEENINTSVPFLQKAGLENVTVTRATGGPVEMFWCAYCWIKNVETAYWIAGVQISGSVRSEVTGSYFHNCDDCQNDGEEYPISVDSASTEILVDNNITLLGGKGMVGRAANTAVVSYNYQDQTMYEQAVIGDWFLDMGVNGSHYAGTHHFLFEGNRGENCDGDETHGNAIYHTFFRNHCAGIRTTFVDPSNGQTVNDSANSCWIGASTPNGCGPLRAAGPMAFNYWYAYVSNVLGLSGTTTTGNGWVYFANNGEPNKEIWMSGWTGSEWGTNPDSNLPNNSSAYIFKNGNYDYVNASIVDYAPGYSDTFPNSLYLSGAPAFFSAGASCTYTWPWVTPNSSPYVLTASGSGSCTNYSGLPAKARFDAGTPFVQP